MFKRRTLVSLLAGASLLVATSAFAQFADRTIKFTNGVNEDHPVGVGVKKMQEVLAAKTGGKMKIAAFWGGAAGGDLPATQALRAGTQEMVCTSSSPLVGIVKELGVFDLPFLFANEKESDAVVDGAIGKKMHALLEPKGIVGLAYWELGYRQITNSKRALNKVEDIEGLKLRVIPNPINVAWVKALGANPTPMPFAEVYGGLEQKAIDGQENPIGVIAANKFWEVQKFMAITNHQYNPQSVLFSKKVWDTLSAAEKKILDDAAHESALVQRKESRAQVAGNLELLKKNGMTVTSFGPAEVAKLREKMKPVIAQFTANVGEPLVNEMNAELAKMRK